MDLSTRNESITELRRNNQRLTLAMLLIAAAVVFLSLKLFFLSEIIVMKTPGMPADAVIQKNSIDKGSQAATLNAVTSTLASINPGNAEFQKRFLQSFWAPETFTKITSEIDLLVEKMRVERENGSRYFIWKGYEYDPALDKHFVKGEVHVVNAARDTFEDHVFEYQIRIDNYRLWIVDAKSYKGDRAHNSEWLKAQTK